MTPFLASRGKLVLITGSSLTVIGTIYAAPLLTALGITVIIALLAIYLWLFPTGILLRHRKIELSWWISAQNQPGGIITPDCTISLHLIIRNRSQRKLYLNQADVSADHCVSVSSVQETPIPAMSEVEFVVNLRPRSCGTHVLQGVTVTFTTAFRMLAIRAYFPNPISIIVFPRTHPASDSPRATRLKGPLHEHVGLHQAQRAGLAGELRELRDHMPGDPFKYIAWKATSRRQKLMVRDLQSDIVINYQIVLDIAGTMRQGITGNTKLDYAIDTITSFTRAALDHGDRVGVVLFDSRVYSQLRPGFGRHHCKDLANHLIESYSVVDEDLTDVTDSELVHIVAKYLRFQESVDVLVQTAPKDDREWAHIHAGADGALYDIGAITTMVTTLLKDANLPPAVKTKLQSIRASSSRMSRLRSFCRVRGLKLPYTQKHPMAKRAHGFAQALSAATTRDNRADIILVFSDLLGCAESPKTTDRALAQAQAGGRLVHVIAPFAPLFALKHTSTAGGQLSHVQSEYERSLVAPTVTAIQRRGIPVSLIGPNQNPQQMRQLFQKLRQTRRQAA